MPARIELSVRERIAEVILNRPDKQNAVDRAMFEALADVGSELALNRSLRAVVLRGAGPAFCAGIDVGSFAAGELPPTDLDPPGDGPANLYQQAAYVWRTLPVPVVAALHGNVFGAGLQIALGADLRIAAPDAKLSVMEIKWGLIPDMAISLTLPMVMPYDLAAELTWSGRVVDGREAKGLGLVSELAERPAERAAAIAAAIAGRSPDAIRAAKRLLLESYAERDRESLAREAALQARILSGANHREAVAANLEKRPPAFGDPEPGLD